MTFPIFSPPVDVSTPTTHAEKPRVLKAEFGEGYNQRAEDGLNAQLERMTVVWSRLTRENAIAIRDFFRARRGVEAFLWTAPDDTEPKLWICESWDRGYPDQSKRSLSAVFQQVLR